MGESKIKQCGQDLQDLGKELSIELKPMKCLGKNTLHRGTSWSLVSMFECYMGTSLSEVG